MIFFKQKYKTVKEFVPDNMETMLRFAKERGYAQRDLMFIPELTVLGQTAVETSMSNPLHLNEYANDAGHYYYKMTEIAFCTGVIFAAMWHENYNYLKNEFADKYMQTWETEISLPIVENLFEMNEDEFGQFIYDLFETYTEEVKPFFKAKNAIEYMSVGLLNVYQLGVSMTLGCLGY